MSSNTRKERKGKVKCQDVWSQKKKRKKRKRNKRERKILKKQHIAQMLTSLNKSLMSANKLKQGRKTSHDCKSTLTWLNKLLMSVNQLLHGLTNFSCLKINFHMV